jgi:hypothetical protein
MSDCLYLFVVNCHTVFRCRSSKSLRKTTSSSKSPTKLAKKWKNKVNPVKYIEITFTTIRALCPQVNINNVPIPIKTEAKYLGLHLDQNLPWQNHIKAKRRQLELKLQNMYWLINKK